MSTNHWICTSCGHEFPDEQAHKVPDKTSMVVLIVVGGLLLLLGVGCLTMLLISYLSNSFDAQLLRSSDSLKGAVGKGMLLGFLGGIGSLAGARSCSKPCRTVCPTCNQPKAIELDSRSGKYFQQQFAKQANQSANDSRFR